MTEPKGETLENQTEKSDQPEPMDPPAPSVNGLNREEPLDDVENEVDEENVPVPQQFQSPYFPNGVYEDAHAPEKSGIRYDPFAVQTDTSQNPDDAPKRKLGFVLGFVVLVLIAALIYGLVTGRLVMPF